MKWLNVITLALVIIGGLNWGLVALGGPEMDLVANLFGGQDAALSRIVYGLVGLSALWQLMPFFKAMRMGEAEAEAAHHGRMTTR
ncbi:conserved hypothetical protein [Phenylobacterium zucineum HLK1]|uniref:DUF378 domain-containing protein n=1 Tax=Phenylobacterium zucineum (strain HLK1) TaxID=450851 RepID=B4RHL1_PHEZH|nr:DUF378 domain-containing protein [Phenylobacterium zucineum]ACG77471.1 conserved hypothetical protein [Phenylobacterium zucineum HLK1]